ncbi:hypothetical protein H4R19_006865, partial [Coemansia spiralis]
MQPPSADAAGSRKKRSSIFKRFSVIVKGARPGSRLPAADSRSAHRIAQAEGDEAGYMEVSVRKSEAGDGGAQAGEQASSQQQQQPSHLAAPESLGARLRGTKSAQKYAALDSIDEDKEYAAGQAPASARIAELIADPARGAPEQQAVAASPERQYLDRPLCSEIRAGDPSSAACNGAQGAPSGTGADLISVLAEDAGPTGGVGGSRGAKTPPHPERLAADGAQAATSPRRLANDGDDVSSIFASTDVEDGGPAGTPGIGRSPSEKAALLERARREIDGFDEQEGVGLLDQTPELSYRVAGQFGRAGLDASKSRARSSSNTVVRMLTDIVRDNGGTSNSSSGGPGQSAGKA